MQHLANFLWRDGAGNPPVPPLLCTSICGHKLDKPRDIFHKHPWRLVLTHIRTREGIRIRHPDRMLYQQLHSETPQNHTTHSPMEASPCQLV